LEKARKAEPEQLDPVSRMERDVGLKPDEVERLHFVGADADARQGWAVGKTLKPIDRERVLRRLKGTVEKRHEGRRYYLGTNADGQELAVHFGGPSVLVVSDEEGMKLAMTQATRPVVDGPLKATIASVETSKSQVIAGIYPAGGGTETMKANAMLKALVEIEKVKAARINLDADEKEATLTVVAEMTDAASAKAAASPLKWGLLKFGAAQTLPDGEGKEAAAKVIRTIKPTAKGNEAQLTAKADTATMASAVAYVVGQALKPREGQ
jgi:hypothetical protein